jgi:cytochrome c-type biogenesis protein
MTDLSLWVAFVGGVVSFASPCVLPLMPGYLGYITGISAEEAEDLSRRTYLFHTMTHAVLFGAGFTTVFVTMGLTATTIGAFLIGNLDLLQRAAGVLLIIFGLHMTGLLRLSWFYRERRVEMKHREAGVVRSYLLGIAFGFGWTPCVGPILGGVLTMAASQEQVLSGGVMLLAFSLGMGAPFLITAFALTFSLSFASRSGKFLHYLHIVAGAVMLVMGVLLLTGQFQKLALLFSGFGVGL